VTARVFWAATILAMAVIGVAQQTPSIRAPYVETAMIRIDGQLNEPAWTNATAVTLVQQTLRLVRQRQRRGRPRVPFVGTLLQPRLADGDDGDFGHRENAVGDQQQKN